jgi:hypothetical protein
MSILTKLRDTFLPSSTVAAKRRKDVFGTESKAVAATVVVGGGAAAIAAGPVIAAAGGARAVAGSVGRAIVANPIKSAAVAFLAPAAITAVASNPKTVTRSAGAVVNIQGNLIETAKSQNKEEFITRLGDTIKENPVASGAVAGLIALGAGTTVVGLSNLVNDSRNRDAVRDNTRAIEQNLIPQEIKALPASTGSVNMPESFKQNSNVSLPQAREVQSSSSGTIAKRRKSKPQTQVNKQSVRVQIINASRLGGRYIKEYRR